MAHIDCEDVEDSEESSFLSAPAKAMMASKSSCRSPMDGPWSSHGCQFDKWVAKLFLCCCVLASSKRCGLFCICLRSTLLELLEPAPRLRGCVPWRELRGIRAVANASDILLNP